MQPRGARRRRPAAVRNMSGWLHAGRRPASEAIRNLLRRQLRRLRRRRAGRLPLQLAQLSQNLLLATCNLHELLLERSGVERRPTRQQHIILWMPMTMCHESSERESEREKTGAHCPFVNEFVR